MARSKTSKESIPTLKVLDTAFLNSRKRPSAKDTTLQSFDAACGNDELSKKRPHKETAKYQEYMSTVKSERSNPAVIESDEDGSHSEKTTSVKRQRKPVVHFQARSPKAPKKKERRFKMNYESFDKATTGLIESIDRYLSTGGIVEQSEQTDENKASRAKMSDKLPSNQPNKCNFCRGCGPDRHEEDDCTEFPTVGTRTFVFKRYKLCKNCLGNNECRDNCEPIPCKYCGKEEHHKALCPDKYAKLDVDHG